MAKFQKHVFICINERADGDARGCCAARGGMQVADAFQSKLHEHGLKRIVRANKAGCLDQCARGVTIVVYPEGTWYGNVTVDDVDEIVREHILCDRPVERLTIAPEHLTGRDPEGVRRP
jgi:(2Fe-2S) ferredoxin